MPPLQALVALHGFWALTLVPLGLWLARTWPPLRLRLAGDVLSTAGLAALVIVLGRDLLNWLPAVGPAQQKYIVQRILYVLGTTTDLPVVQVIVTGIALQWTARRRKRHAVRAEGERAQGLALAPGTRRVGQ
jgi:hypothetical protein